MSAAASAPQSVRSLAPLARWLVGMYGLIALLSLLTLLQVARLSYLTAAVAARRPLQSDALARWLVPRGVKTGELSFDGMLFALLESLGRLEILVFALAVPTGVLTYVFLFRVRSNAVALGGAPRYAKHWIVTGFVVPVLNLVRPYQVVADLWRASAPARAEAAPVLVRLWWEALLVANVLALGAGWRAAHRSHAETGLVVATALARLTLLALGVLLVRSFVERQSARAEARELRPTMLGRLPGHAGVDVAFVTALGLVVGAGAWLGDAPLGVATATHIHDQELAAVEAARVREARQSDSGLASDSLSPRQQVVEAVNPESDGGASGSLGSGDSVGDLEGGVEGGVEGGIEGGLAGGVVGGVVGGRTPQSTPDTPGRTEPLRGFGPLERIAGDAPSYPRSAREAGVQGTVILELVVDESGAVIEVKVVKGLPSGLTQAAMNAAMTWRFRPAVLDGRPVRVVETVPVVFRLAP